MRFIHSYWTKPSLLIDTMTKENDFESNYYRLNQRINFLHQGLSCVLAKLNFGNIHLVTDSYGKKILIDELNFPYDSSSIELNSLSNYSKNLWALGKIKAYSIQKVPFIHIDNDLFIWKNISFKLNKGLIVQNYDRNNLAYKHVLNEMIFNEIEFPSWVDLDKLLKNDIISINAGFLGGNDIEFIGDFTREVFKFLDCNVNKDLKNNTAVIYEQLFFSLFSLYKKKILNPLIEEQLVLDNTISDITNNMIAENDFCHLISKMKVDSFSCYYVANLLKTLDVNLYNRIANFDFK